MSPAYFYLFQLMKKKHTKPAYQKCQHIDQHKADIGEEQEEYLFCLDIVTTLGN